MPTPNTPFKFAEAAAGSDYYNYQKAMDEFLKPYNDTDCDLQRFGGDHDGGYLVCANFLSKAEGLINLGVEGRDTLGCELSTKYKFPNYQYDCTNNVVPACATNNGLNHFESACIAAETEQVGDLVYYSLKDMVRAQNLTKKHIIIKIDVEGAEWPGLRSFPVEDLQYVDQLIIEFHLRGRQIYHPQSWGNVDIVRSLSKDFVPVWLHQNNFACVNPNELQQKTMYYPSFAIEATLVNKRLITIKNPTRAHFLHKLDQINLATRP